MHIDPLTSRIEQTNRPSIQTGQPETTYEMVLKLIRAHSETGICTRHIWNLVGRDRRDPAVLKHLAKNVHIYASKSYNKRAGTRWYPVTTNTSSPD